MKKFLSVVLAILMCISIQTYVFADDGSGKKDVGEHEHELMDMANAACHYSECTICFELFNVGDHTFENGACTVCGHYEFVKPTDEDIKGEGAHEHIFMKSADDETHFEECLVCHENGKCYVCGHPLLVNPFTDVKDNAWYRNDIVAAVSLGVINGKSETIFAPDDNLTYAEAIKLAACMNQRSLHGKVTLTNGSPWYKTYVDYCKENGIISKDYEYEKVATRAGYMEIFANALADEALKEINAIADGAIPDVQMKESFAPGVYKLYRAGILQGVDAQFNCNPEANIKRGEVAVILVRMLDEEKRIKFDIPESVNMGTINEKPGEDDEEAEDLIYIKTDEIADEPDEDDVNETIVYINSEDDEEEAEEDEESDEDSEEINHVVAPGLDYDIPIKYPTVEGEKVVEVETVIVPGSSYVPGNNNYISDTHLTIHKQPEGYEADSYGEKCELEVVVFGGKAPYTYEWLYYGYRNQKTKIEMVTM